METPLCRCKRPIHDMAYVCRGCTLSVAEELARAAAVVDEAETTIARLSRVASGGGSSEQATAEPRMPNALRPTPLLFNASASDRYAAAVNAVDTQARDIAATRGRPLPAPCEHRTCGLTRTGQASGPACAHPLAATLYWLADQLEWLRHRRDAERDLDDLRAAARSLVNLVDRPPQRLIVGQCACGRYLYAIKGATTVRCRDCGNSYDVASSRDSMIAYIDDALLTAAEIGRLSVYLGIESNSHRVRKLVTMWGQRRLLLEHDYKGEICYRFGDALTRLARLHAAS